MLAHEALLKAAEIVRTGWSEGSEAARDAEGNPVPLFVHATGGTSRAGINPAAARFSAYGAIAKVLSMQGAGGFSHGRIWLEVSRLAKDTSPARPGGTNYMHPLVQFNADNERTAEDVARLLERAAANLAPRKAAG